MVRMINVGLFTNPLSSRLANDDWRMSETVVMCQPDVVMCLRRLISSKHSGAQSALSVGGGEIKEEWLTAMSEQPASELIAAAPRSAA